MVQELRREMQTQAHVYDDTGQSFSYKIMKVGSETEHAWHTSQFVVQAVNICPVEFQPPHGFTYGLTPTTLMGEHATPVTHPNNFGWPDRLSL